MRVLAAQLQRLKDYDRLANISEIARRYFAMNTFDGLLTVIGVLMGNYTAHVIEARIVISTGMATAIAMGISGLWGSYLTEVAERKRSLAALESHTLTDLADTRFGQAFRVAAVIVAIVDGISPFMAALLVLTPFFFAALLPSLAYAYYISLGLALLLLALVGGFLGVVSRENVVVSGIKMIGAGVLSILVASLLHL